MSKFLSPKLADDLICELLERETLRFKRIQIHVSSPRACFLLVDKKLQMKGGRGWPEPPTVFRREKEESQISSPFGNSWDAHTNSTRRSLFSAFEHCIHFKQTTECMFISVLYNALRWQMRMGSDSYGALTSELQLPSTFCRGVYRLHLHKYTGVVWSLICY